VARLKTGLQEVWEFGALIGRHPRMPQVFVSAAASVAIDPRWRRSSSAS